MAEANMKKSPQQILSEFWDSFHTKNPGKVTSIFPRALYASLLAPTESKGASSTSNAQASYEIAARECREKVKRIVRECERTNQKFTDPDFDIERDPRKNCLNGLVRDGDDLDTSDSDDAGRSPEENQDSGSARPKSAPKTRKRRGVCGSEFYSPGSTHRVDWIFDSPKFTMDGYSSSDIKQGANGNCWWLAAVATIAHRKDLMQRVCVARDEECGVYGFVFQRDGEWVSTVVDDNLYLNYSDYDVYGDSHDSSGKKGRQHRARFQSGSEALYFAHCEDENETWLPLLEKAYAKIHGDYEAISGGWSGEAVEDMTGGVTSTIPTNRVLRKDRLWREMTNTEDEFVFALSAMDGGAGIGQKTGLALDHAYSILQSREEVSEDGKKVRLVQIRNPWGQSSGGVGEWMGPWSDGSKEWTPYWMKRLDHTFGDDGVFWMSFDDMFSNFMFLHRTRLFDEKWTVVQQWTSANISWLTGFLQMKFVVDIKKPGMVVFVLTQLDERYFRGLEGEYWFQLHFILQKKTGDGDSTAERICQVMPVHEYENRAVSCEIDLEPGLYEVLPKITATRHDADSSAHPVEKVVKKYADSNPQKLRQIGALYDEAHAKGGVLDEDGELQRKKDAAKQAKLDKKAKQKRKEKKALADAAKTLEETAKVVAEIAGESHGEATQKEDSKKDDNEDSKKESGTTGGTGAEHLASADHAQKPTGEGLPHAATATLSDTAPKVSPEKHEQNGVAEVSEAKKETAAEEEEKAQAPEPQLPAAEEEDDSSDESDSDDESVVETLEVSWNAVCVFSLRVYAQDPDVSITLVK